MRDHHDADPRGGHGPIRGSGIKHDNCPGCEYCRPGEPAGAVGGVPPPELEQIIERMRRMAMDARQSRENPLNIEADGYYSGAEALEYFANQLAAAPRGAPAEPEGYQQKKIAILLNRLVLASIAKGAQSQLDLAAEDRITDADLEAIEQKILAAAAPRCAPQGEWQPIETAPKDRAVLLWWSEASNRPVVGLWCKRGKGHWFSDVTDCQEPEGSNPTHWMPLPSAPVASASTPDEKK